jgi:hypothetical protein
MSCTVKILLVAGDLLLAVVEDHVLVGQIEKTLRPAQGIEQPVLFVDLAPLLQDAFVLPAGIRKRLGQQLFPVFGCDLAPQNVLDVGIQPRFLPNGPERPWRSGRAVFRFVAGQRQHKLGIQEELGNPVLGLVVRKLVDRQIDGILALLRIRRALAFDDPQRDAVHE